MTDNKRTQAYQRNEPPPEVDIALARYMLGAGISLARKCLTIDDYVGVDNIPDEIALGLINSALTDAIAAWNERQAETLKNDKNMG